MDQHIEAGSAPAGSQVVRFGAFTLNMQTGELRKHAVRVRLQAKPFQILYALLEQPGRVITREELRQRLWPSDSAINFESGLNTAINRLRIALSDSAEHPVFIETITRLGYRFIAPLERAHAVSGNGWLPDEPKNQAFAELNGPGKIGQSRKLLKYAKTYWPIPVFALLLGAVAAALHVDRARNSDLSFEQLTFQKGFATGARFTPDGNGIAYSARWNGQPSRVFLMSGRGGQARELPGPDARLAGFPAAGQVGFFTHIRDSDKMELETESLSGGRPTAVSDHAIDADWSHDGKLAMVTVDGSYYSIEYPPGNVLYRSLARLNNLRVSPRSDRVAFAEHPVPLDDGGRVMVVDALSKQVHALSSGWESIEGLAWHPSEREVWFTAATSGIERSLMAATLDGRVRSVAQMPGGMEIDDVSASGKILIDRSTDRMIMMLGTLDGSDQRDISWLDWSRAVAISADGKSVLFDESGGGGGAAYSVFVAQPELGTPRRIGAGRAMDLSPDGRWALAQDSSDAAKLTLLAADGSQQKPVQNSGIVYRWVRFVPGQLAIVFAGTYANQPLRLYRQVVPDGPVTLIASDISFEAPVLSPDGQLMAAADEANGIVVMDLVNGGKRRVPLKAPAYPVAFSGNDEVLLSDVQNRTITLSRLTLNNGQIAPYKRIEMSDTPGITETLPVCISRNLHTLVYSRAQSLSNLFVVSGWK